MSGPIRCREQILERAPRTPAVDTIEVETVVHLPPEETYEFLLDFPRYANYSEYLEDVEERGDGGPGPGTRYALRFSWWRLSYTAHSRVTDVDPPRRIDWEVTRDVDAHGQWEVDSEPGAGPDGGEASRVRLVVTYDPDSARAETFDLPALVSLSWVVDRVTGLIEEEGERVTERIVADLEGEPRAVELSVEHRSS